VRVGASEVRLLEVATVLAEPYIIDRVTDASGSVLYEESRSARQVNFTDLSLIQGGTTVQ
jgi:hypothetical protein